MDLASSVTSKIWFSPRRRAHFHSFGFLFSHSFLFDVEWFLHRILTTFASFSDPRSDRNRSPEVSERDPKKDTNKCCVWKASGSILHGSWGGSANSVSNVFCALGAVLGGRWSQDAPRALPRPIWDRFGMIFDRFSMDLSCSCRRFFLRSSASWELNLVCYVVPEIKTMSFHLAVVLWQFSRRIPSSRHGGGDGPKGNWIYDHKL